jgi:hypothetical protein
MHPIAPYARTAYAHGFAISGGPMTERVKAGCVAAVQMAVEHADDPDVLEATLHLGHLEGVWAAVFDRRHARHADADRELIKLWNELAADLDLGLIVRAVRQHAGLGEARPDPATVTAVAIATGLALSALRALARKPLWGRLRQAVRDAIAAAHAEGHTDAVALAADAAGRVAPAFDIAYDDAYAALANLESLYTEADTWLSNLLDDVADALGRRLATIAADGADYTAMLDAGLDLIGPDNPRAVAAAIDLLVSRAMSQGALDLYAAMGVDLVDILTAGDGRVCQRCVDAEENGPYSPSNAPVPGLHPRCRCVPVISTRSAASLPESLVAQYSATNDDTEG